MFKSKQNYSTLPNALKTFSGFQDFSQYYTQPFSASKIKKGGVRFQMEENKESYQVKNTHFQQEFQTKLSKKTNKLYQSTVTQKRIPNKENEFLLDTSNRFNQNQIYFQKVDRRKTGFSNAKEKQIKNKQQSTSNETISFSTMKKSKSMKNFDYHLESEQNIQQKLQKKRSERKFQNFTAFDNLLKQTQNLVQKYKKLENQKYKIKTDLQNQVQFRTKSSKKIFVLQQVQNQYQKQKQNVIVSHLKNYKNTDFSYSKKNITIKNNDKIQSFDSYSKNKPIEGSTTQNQNNQRKQPKKQLKFSKSVVVQKEDFNSCSYNGSFGFYKSTSKKNISQFKLSLDDFQLGKVLGSGAFGQVFPAKHKQTGWLFALKKIKKASIKHMLDQFIQEIKIQLFLDHPNIVKLYAFFDDQLHFYILMEYMQGGSLYSYLKKKKTLSVEETSSKLKEVCEGLKYMHDNSVAHRDIKPQNIVLAYNVPKLCDFGWSAILTNRRTTFCGTLDYVCPQILQGQDYDGSVDIWSLGVLAYQLLVGKTPFYNISRKQTMKKIVDCNLQFPETVPKVAVDFISNILKKNPEHRQSIQEILKEPFLRISQNQKSSI